jgi:phosphonate transport system substrate-binding protein
MNNSVMTRDDIPETLRDRVQTLLVALDEAPEGKAILSGMSTARFHLADDTSYNKAGVINEP